MSTHPGVSFTWLEGERRESYKHKEAVSVIANVLKGYNKLIDTCPGPRACINHQREIHALHLACGAVAHLQ